MNVYLEIGEKRTFAAALDWPGWSRNGKDEAVALQTLLDYGPRYARAIASARLAFVVPESIHALTVVERLVGNVGTDFGAPNVAPSADDAPVAEAELERFQAVLQAMWGSFDATIKIAEGRALRTGPRGGGRDLDKIVEHVFEAELAYLNRLGGALSVNDKKAGPPQGLVHCARQSSTVSAPQPGASCHVKDRAAGSAGRRAAMCGTLHGTCSTTTGRSKIA